MLTAHHPQTDGKPEPMNKMLETNHRQFEITTKTTETDLHQRQHSHTVHGSITLPERHHFFSRSRLQSKTPIGYNLSSITGCYTNIGSVSIYEKLGRSIRPWKTALFRCEFMPDRKGTNVFTDRCYQVGDQVLVSVKILADPCLKSQTFLKLQENIIGPLEIISLVVKNRS